MGRRPRIEYYGAIYHIIQRGKDREAIFADKGDKIYLLEIVSESKEIYDFKLFAYVIMDNHYHFLIQTLNIPISKIMHRINTNYAKYYNKKMNRTGPVFEDRYKGILVQDESYLLTLVRYIHNNPVKAKICRNMEEYPWSSDIFYRMNVEKIVDIGSLLDSLSPNRIKAIESYKLLMEEEDKDYALLEDKYEKSPIIGSEAFIRSLEEPKEKPISLDEILSGVCPDELEFNLIKAGSRKRYLTKYKKEYILKSKRLGYTYEEIGDNIGLTARAIKNIIK